MVGPATGGGGTGSTGTGTGDPDVVNIEECMANLAGLGGTGTDDAYVVNIEERMAGLGGLGIAYVPPADTNGVGGGGDADHSNADKVGAASSIVSRGAETTTHMLLTRDQVGLFIGERACTNHGGENFHIFAEPGGASGLHVIVSAKAPRMPQTWGSYTISYLARTYPDGSP